MTRKFLLTLVAIVLVLAVHAASAQSVYTPMQKAHSGLWFDPDFNGQGVDLTVVDTAPNGRTTFAIVYGGEIEGVPAWFHATGTPIRGGTQLALRATAAEFGRPSTGASAPVGELLLQPVSCDAIRATFRVSGGAPVTWNLQRVTPSGGQCYTCVSPDFSPTPPGCGF